MTRYVFKLDPVGDRSLLNDGDTFTIYPHSTNTAGSRIEVGFCSGAYPIFDQSGQPLPPGYFLPDAPYDITWDADRGAFTTPVNTDPFVCYLNSLAGAPLPTWDDVISVPLPPFRRRLTLSVELPDANTQGSAFFTYTDYDPAISTPGPKDTNLGVSNPIRLYWMDTLGNLGIDAAELATYQVRLTVLPGAVLPPNPAAVLGDPIGQWLFLDELRAWAFEAYWDEPSGGTFNPVNLQVLVEFRATTGSTAPDSDLCASSITADLFTNEYVFCDLEKNILDIPSPPITMPYPPSDPLQRRVSVNVESPLPTSQAGIFIGYEDYDADTSTSSNSVNLGSVPWVDASIDTSETAIGENYEVRLVREFPTSDPWPFRTGDPVDTWLPLTADRKWTFIGYWDAQSGWVPFSLHAYLQFRGGSDNIVTCNSNKAFFIESGDVS